MAFDVFILCMIAAAFAMWIVSVFQAAVRRFGRAMTRALESRTLPPVSGDRRGDAYRGYG
jgi:hypothetical protein